MEDVFYLTRGWRNAAYIMFSALILLTDFQDRLIEVIKTDMKNVASNINELHNNHNTFYLL
jgi:hypothetical protein